MKRQLYNIIAIPLMAFLGGFCAQVFLATTPVYAQQAAKTPKNYEGPPTAQTLVAHPELNKRGIQVQVGASGQPNMFFFAPDGKTRLQFGNYTKGEEKGLPMFGLSDNRGELRMLVKLSGKNQAPAIIMKDKQGKDRLIFGLSPTDPYEVPFMTVIDASGNKRNIF